MWICGYVGFFFQKIYAQMHRYTNLSATYPLPLPSYPRLSTKLSPTYPRKLVENGHTANGNTGLVSRAPARGCPTDRVGAIGSSGYYENEEGDRDASTNETKNSSAYRYQ